MAAGHAVDVDRLLMARDGDGGIERQPDAVAGSDASAGCGTMMPARLVPRLICRNLHPRSA
jgi:hypothetical protein